MLHKENLKCSVNTQKIKIDTKKKKQVSMIKSVSSKEDLNKLFLNQLQNFTPTSKNISIKKQFRDLKPKSSLINFNVNNNPGNCEIKSILTPKTDMKKINYNVFLNSNCILTTNSTDHKEDELPNVNSNVTTPKTFNKEMQKSTQEEKLILNTENSVKNSNHPLVQSNILQKISLLPINSIQITRENEHSLLDMNESENLLTENNVIKRDTFIDTNVNKKFPVGRGYNEMKTGLLFESIDEISKDLTEKISQNTSRKIIQEEEKSFYTKKDMNILNEDRKTVKNINLSLDDSYSFVDSCSDMDFLNHLIVNNRNEKFVNLSPELSFIQSKEENSNSNINDHDTTQYQYEDYAFRNISKFHTLCTKEAHPVIDVLPEPACKGNNNFKM